MGSSFRNSPVLQHSGFGIKRNTNLVELSGIRNERQGIIFAVNLCKRRLCRFIPFKRKQIDILSRLNPAVNTPRVRMHLTLAELSQQCEGQVDDRLEIMLKGI